MSQEDPSARIDSYLQTLRRLKETSARRDVLERELFLAVLLANKGRLTESPTLDNDQQHLASAIAMRGEPHPAHAWYRDWMSQFSATLNQYEVAARTGQEGQAAALLGQLVNNESLLAKCLQGYILLSGVVRDDFNDVIISRFGETALADIDELTHAGFSDDRYWKALMERFALGFVTHSYPELISGERFRLGREGAFVAVRLPLDGLLELLPGTDKDIEKTRLQTLVHSLRDDPQQTRCAQAATAMLAGLDRPLLPGKPSKADLDLLGRMACLDPAAARFVEVFIEGKPLNDDELPPEPDADNPGRSAARADAAREFIRNQLVAMAAGCALALCNLREDIAKAMNAFPPRDVERLLAVAQAFDPATLATTHSLMLELALCRLLSEKVQDEGGKVQVKTVRQRRAARKDVEALAAGGFNRIRQKVFFEDDPASKAWLLFKDKTPQELAEAIKLANMGPELSQALTALWMRMEFKTEVVALVNLQLVAKTSPNVQARLAEILAKLGMVKSAQSPAPPAEGA